MVTAQPPASVQPGAPFSLTVAVQYSDTGALKTAYNGPVTVALANNPGGSVLNGTTTVTAAGGVATFNGLSVSNVGTGYTLVASAPGIAGSAATGGFDVSTTAPPPPPTSLPPTIVGSQVLFTRKTNRKGKPVGKPVFVGFQFTFSTAMDGSAGIAANYQMGTFVTKTRQAKARHGRQADRLFRESQRCGQRGDADAGREAGLQDRGPDHPARQRPPERREHPHERQRRLQYRQGRQESLAGLSPGGP